MVASIVVLLLAACVLGLIVMVRERRYLRDGRAEPEWLFGPSRGRFVGLACAILGYGGVLTGIMIVRGDYFGLFVVVWIAAAALRLAYMGTKPLPSAG